MKKCEFFANYHCSCSDCPNIQYDACEERWGYGIPEDIGMHRIPCNKCIYNDKSCTCDDCGFNGGPDCPHKESDIA
jgi:hypothetical protein